MLKLRSTVQELLCKDPVVLNITLLVVAPDFDDKHGPRVERTLLVDKPKHVKVVVQRSVQIAVPLDACFVPANKHILRFGLHERLVGLEAKLGRLVRLGKVQLEIRWRSRTGVVPIFSMCGLPYVWQQLCGLFAKLDIHRVGVDVELNATKSLVAEQRPNRDFVEL